MRLCSVQTRPLSRYLAAKTARRLYFVVLLACAPVIAVEITKQSAKKSTSCMSKQRVCQDGNCTETLTPCEDQGSLFDESVFGGSLINKEFLNKGFLNKDFFSNAASLFNSDTTLTPSNRTFAAANVTLVAGNTVTAVVQFETAYEGLEFHLCNGTACSGVVLWGLNNGLVYAAIIRENSRGLAGDLHYKNLPEGQDELQFSAGELVFEVEHRADEFAVRLRGHPNKAAVVPVEGTFETLMVLPNNREYLELMAVEFSGNAASCDETKLRCLDDGACVDRARRCDGLAHCDDGSDEGPSLCKAHSKELPIGNVVTVRVFKKAVHQSIQFHLCPTKQGVGKACSGIDLVGSDPSANLAFSGRDHRRRTLMNNPSNWSWFPEGEYAFEAQHRHSELAVWLRGHPDKAAIVPADADQNMLLSVRPRVWAEDMAVEFQGNGPACRHAELRCFDGQCVEPSQRCDGRYDCSDGADEDPALCRKQASSAAYVAATGTCGVAGAGPTRLVQDGEKTPIEYVPWHAGIFIERNGHIENVCGGSLVSPCVVVTAAHCILEGKMFVALGKFLSGWDTESGEHIHKTPVKNVTKHPHYQGYPTKLAYDVAVLVLEHCSPTHDKIATVCMNKSIQPVSGTDIKVAGWGDGKTTITETVATELESVTLQQLRYGECLADMADNDRHVAFITHDKFCATRRKDEPKAQGLLQGDSGGGAVVKRAGSWFLAGVVSARVQNGRQENVYALTDVSLYEDWIRDFI